MRLRLYENIHHITLYKFCVLYEIQLFSMFAMAAESFHRLIMGKNWKATFTAKPFKMVYPTDRSKTVVPVLVLLFGAMWFILRGDLLYKKS